MFGKTSLIEKIILVNPGEWFGNVWILSIANGIEADLYAIEAECEQDAIDAFTDSKHGPRIQLGEGETEDENTTYAGNAGIPVCLDNVRLQRAPKGFLYMPEGESEQLPAGGLTPKAFDAFQSISFIGISTVNGKTVPNFGDMDAAVESFKAFLALLPYSCNSKQLEMLQASFLYSYATAYDAGWDAGHNYAMKH